jgi:hypothetical protein
VSVETRGRTLCSGRGAQLVDAREDAAPLAKIRRVNPVRPRAECGRSASGCGGRRARRMMSRCARCSPFSWRVSAAVRPRTPTTW